LAKFQGIIFTKLLQEINVHTQNFSTEHL